jgi:hypothetical protein
VPYELKNKEGYTIGAKFASVEDAKRVVPRVHEWRPDESRPMGWNGWLPARAPAAAPPPAPPAAPPPPVAPHPPAASAPPPAGSEPDYKITFVQLRLT